MSESERYMALWASGAVREAIGTGAVIWPTVVGLAALKIREVLREGLCTSGVFENTVGLCTVGVWNGLRVSSFTGA